MERWSILAIAGQGKNSPGTILLPSLPRGLIPIHRLIVARETNSQAADERIGSVSNFLDMRSHSINLNEMPNHFNQVRYESSWQNHRVRKDLPSRYNRINSLRPHPTAKTRNHFNPVITQIVENNERELLREDSIVVASL